MLRNFCWTSVLSVILTPLMTGVAKSNPIPTYSQKSEIQKPAVDVPLCYMQTEDGRIMDLQKLCGKTAPASTNLASDSDFRVGSGGGYYRLRSREDH